MSGATTRLGFSNAHSDTLNRPLREFACDRQSLHALCKRADGARAAAAGLDLETEGTNCAEIRRYIITDYHLLTRLRRSQGCGIPTGRCTCARRFLRLSFAGVLAEPGAENLVVLHNVWF